MLILGVWVNHYEHRFMVMTHLAAGLGLGLIQDLSLILLGVMSSELDDSPFLTLEDFLFSVIFLKETKSKIF